MQKNTHGEVQQTLYSKMEQNRPKVSSNHMEHFLAALDNKSEYLFSRPLVVTKHNVPHATSQLSFQQTQRCYETVSKHPHKLPPIKKKSSTESEMGNFLPHEIDLPLEESDSSSPSSSGVLGFLIFFLMLLASSTSVCKEYLLPIIYENLESDKEKKQQIIESNWGRGTTLDIGLWENDNALVIKIKTKEDIELGITEANDVLSDEMVGACSSFLSKSPEIGLYVENKCELMKMNLRDISVLYYHHYLQYIDLANNNISDLKPLGGIPYLMYLNVKQNKLKDVLRFTPPWYLTHVNLTRNQISKIDDLSEFWSIVSLDLSHNLIESIEGLHNLRHLRFLNLGYNLIECVENLDNLNIQELNLEYNCITDFKSATTEIGISTLPNLRSVILGHNKLSTLAFFEGAYALRYIDLKYNKIVDLLEVSHLKSLVYEVDFRGNPCTKWPSYRDVVLFSMPSVMFVDGASVTVSEKVSASTIFAPPMELIAARSITKLMLLEHLNPPNIDMHITPIDQSTPPLIILSGPPATKKSILARQIADGLSKQVRYCASHTTRDPANDNLGRLNYQFVSREEFNEMTRRGEFLSTEELLGNSYGFHVSEIAALVSENKVGITHMDLHGALEMQGRYVNAKLILVLTKSEELHRQWIQEKFEVFTWVKSSEQNLVSIKVGKHRQHIHESKESIRSEPDSIGEILNEVIETLELPLFNIDLTPQGIERLSTGISVESPTVLPTVAKTASKIEIEKKHISFQGEGKKYSLARSFKVNVTPEKPAAPTSDGLKIIFDEQSNVIIEDEEQKRERRKEKLRLRHKRLRIQMDNGEFSDEEMEDEVEEEQKFGDSASSEDIFISKPYPSRMETTKVLEEHYSKLVIKSREIYLRHHHENPGCFSLVVFTDEFVSAHNQVIDLIYEFYVNQPLRKPIFSTEFRKLTQTIISSKTESFLEELRQDLSTSKNQRSLNLRLYGLTSWNQTLPSQLSQDAAEIVTHIDAKHTEESRNVIAEKKST